MHTFKKFIGIFEIFLNELRKYSVIMGQLTKIEYKEQVAGLQNREKAKNYNWNDSENVTFDQF